MVQRSDRNRLGTLKLEDGGNAYAMGGGLFILMQRDPLVRRRSMRSVVVSAEDLVALRSASGATTITLDDGEAMPMGGGLFAILQAHDGREGALVQNVFVTAADVAMLIAA